MQDTFDRALGQTCAHRATIGHLVYKITIQDISTHFRHMGINI